MIILITFFVSTFTEQDQVKLHEKPVAAKMLRVLAVQLALITVLIGAVLEGVHGESWELTLGILLFFWHWERLYMYHIDYQDGKFPRTFL
jgi:hypothetical protein